MAIIKENIEKLMWTILDGKAINFKWLYIEKERVCDINITHFVRKEDIKVNNGEQMVKEKRGAEGEGV